MLVKKYVRETVLREENGEWIIEEIITWDSGSTRTIPRFRLTDQAQAEEKYEKLIKLHEDIRS